MPVKVEGPLVAAGHLARAQPRLTKPAPQWRGRSVSILRGTADAPYKCLGFAVYALQRERVDAGIDSILQPPPETD